MKKPANAGAHGLSGNVSLQADIAGYATVSSALQARSICRRFAVSAAVAAAIAEIAYGTPETWRIAR